MVYYGFAGCRPYNQTIIFLKGSNQLEKICLFLLALSIVMGLCTAVVFADEDYRQEGEFWMYDAPKTDEILIRGAGLDSTTWTVPYLTEKPTIDGAIGETEHKRFENFEDYLTLMAPTSGTTLEEFDTFRMNADHFGGAGGFVVPYWGWDGEYLYMAFVVQNLSGFYCNPPHSSTCSPRTVCRSASATSTFATISTPSRASASTAKPAS